MGGGGLVEQGGAKIGGELGQLGLGHGVTGRGQLGQQAAGHAREGSDACRAVGTGQQVGTENPVGEIAEIGAVDRDCPGLVRANGSAKGQGRVAPGRISADGAGSTDELGGKATGINDRHGATGNGGRVARSQTAGYGRELGPQAGCHGAQRQRVVVAARDVAEIGVFYAQGPDIAGGNRAIDRYVRRFPDLGAAGGDLALGHRELRGRLGNGEIRGERCAASAHGKRIAATRGRRGHLP